MLRHIYATIRRRIRRRRWRTPPELLPFRDLNGKSHCAVPVGVAGLRVLTRQGSHNHSSVTYAQAKDKRKFMMAWYALGGGYICNGRGTPIDPDDSYCESP